MSASFKNKAENQMSTLINTDFSNTYIRMGDHYYNYLHIMSLINQIICVYSSVHIALN